MEKREQKVTPLFKVSLLTWSMFWKLVHFKTLVPASKDIISFGRQTERNRDLVLKGKKLMVHLLVRKKKDIKNRNIQNYVVLEKQRSMKNPMFTTKKIMHLF